MGVQWDQASLNCRKGNIEIRVLVNIPSPSLEFIRAKMTGTESISLHSVVSITSEREARNYEEDATTLDNPGQQESRQKRACVLLGSAILQLPIWGKYDDLP